MPIFVLLCSIAFANAGGASELALSGRFFGSALISGLPAALIGAYAMHRAAMLRSESTLIGGAAVAFACAGFVSVVIQAERVADGLWVGLGAGCCFGPVGLVASTLLVSPLTHLLLLLVAPSIETPSIARIKSVFPLTVMTFVTMLPMHSAAPSCVGLFAALGVRGSLATGLAWLVFVGPLACMTLALLLVGRREQRSVQRFRQAILNGTHPEYYPGDIAPEDDATPLTEADRKSAVKRVLVRRASSAYRSDAGGVNVYVGLDSATSS